MIDVPFLYVNLIAFCSFVLMFITFLAAKKTAEIRSFIVMMLGFVIWSGGSILMRLQTFPGLAFWYYVSLMALFALPLLIFFFVCSFVRVKGYFLKLVWTALTVALVAVTPFGWIMPPPNVSSIPGVGTVYTYAFAWATVFPCIVLLLIVGSIIKIFRDVIHEKGIKTPGIINIIIGCIAVAGGSMLQCLPGSFFPWDTLGGIIFAVLMVYALYKKRMFRLTLLVSRSALTLTCAAVCVLAAAYFVSPLQDFLVSHFSISANTATTLIVILFAVALYVIYILPKRLLDSLFTREEQQGRLLKVFSSAVSQTLDTGEIMEKMTELIKSEISVGCVYVCLPDNGDFTVRYTSDTLAKRSFSVSADSPCVKYLKKGENYLLMSEFVNDPLYLSTWQEEKELFRRQSIACVGGLKDGEEIVGLVLLSEKDRNTKFTYGETSLLETVLSIASIAVKNASLYEKIYREARIDSLTGVYNYRYFVERLRAEFAACEGSSLALLYVDMDDFKLYNQLYGSVEGDRALRMTADALTMCASENGTVFRSSGKVFAVLLPGFDGRKTEMLAREIQNRIRAINAVPARSHFKPISVSCGICVSPHAAASANELMENADLAVYNAKQGGKSRINVFRGSEPVHQRVSEKALDIVEKAEAESAAYQSNSTTIFALTAAIDAKDHYTYQHSRNVARYAAILATANGLNDEQVAVIYEAGLLHDIGKISIPESILGKTAKLTDEEYSTIKGHVNSSMDMIRYLPAMDYVIPAALGHHERWDGKGYPRGIAGKAIPIGARCLALADAFDAMTTDRPYRSGFTFSYAADEIERGAGTQFDPELAAVFVSLIRTNEMSKSE